MTIVNLFAAAGSFWYSRWSWTGFGGRRIETSRFEFRQWLNTPGCGLFGNSLLSISSWVSSRRTAYYTECCMCTELIWLARAVFGSIRIEEANSDACWTDLSRLSLERGLLALPLRLNRFLTRPVWSFQNWFRFYGCCCCYCWCVRAGLGWFYRRHLSRYCSTCLA